MKMDINKIRKANAKILALFEADKNKYDLIDIRGLEEMEDISFTLTCGEIWYSFSSRKGLAGFYVYFKDKRVITLCDERCDTIRGALYMYDLLQRSLKLLETCASDASSVKSDVERIYLEFLHKKAKQAGMYGSVV